MKNLIKESYIEVRSVFGAEWKGSPARAVAVARKIAQTRMFAYKAYTGTDIIKFSKLASKSAVVCLKLAKTD